MRGHVRTRAAGPQLRVPHLLQAAARAVLGPVRGHVRAADAARAGRDRGGGGLDRGRDLRTPVLAGRDRGTGRGRAAPLLRQRRDRALLRRLVVRALCRVRGARRVVAGALRVHAGPELRRQQPRRRLAREGGPVRRLQPLGGRRGPVHRAPHPDPEPGRVGRTAGRRHRDAAGVLLLPRDGAALPRDRRRDRPLELHPRGARVEDVPDRLPGHPLRYSDRDGDGDDPRGERAARRHAARAGRRDAELGEAGGRGGLPRGRALPHPPRPHRPHPPGIRDDHVGVHRLLRPARPHRRRVARVP